MSDIYLRVCKSSNHDWYYVTDLHGSYGCGGDTVAEAVDRWFSETAASASHKEATAADKVIYEHLHRAFDLGKEDYWA